MPNGRQHTYKQPAQFHKQTSKPQISFSNLKELKTFSVSFNFIWFFNFPHHSVRVTTTSGNIFQLKLSGISRTHSPHTLSLNCQVSFIILHFCRIFFAVCFFFSRKIYDKFKQIVWAPAPGSVNNAANANAYNEHARRGKSERAKMKQNTRQNEM